ncbi:hypothetical protein pb186bvf_012105 [Paramecium bursaria]
MYIFLFYLKLSLSCLLQYSSEIDRYMDRVEMDRDANNERVYVIWSRYYPFVDDYSAFYNYQGIIFREVDESMNSLLTYYMSINNQQAQHFIEFNTGVITTQVFTLEANTQRYEGRWILMYIYYNNRKSKIYSMLYAAGQAVNEIQFQVFSGTQYKAKYYLYLEYLAYASGIQLNAFQGFVSIKLPNDTDEPYFTTTQQLYDKLQAGCDIGNYCQNYQVNELILTLDQIVTQFDLDLPLVTYYNSYSITGWFKFIPFALKHNVFLIKLVQYGKEFDQSNGVIALKIDINYNQLQPSLGGITVSTYSYKSPKWNEPQSDAIKYQSISEQTQQNMQTWTYFRFITGAQVSPTENAEVYFNFVQKNSVQKYAYANLNQYQYGKLKIYVGNSNLTIESFSGQIANLQFKSCVTYKPPILQCHFSCNTCIGPTSNDCINCDTNSNRDYNMQTSQCICKNNYIQVDNQQVCQKISVYQPNIKIVKETTTQVANKCDKGYFFLSDFYQCYQCPQQQNSDSTLLCGDCLDKPYDWIYILNCTYDYKIIGDISNNAYQKVYRDPRSIDLYVFTEQQYQAVLTYYPGGRGLCNDTIYVDCNSIKVNNKIFGIICLQNYIFDPKTQNCQYSVDNCLETDYVKCSKCELGFYLSDQFTCISCPENCLTCKESNLTTSCSSCVDGYTVQADRCSKCGIFCKKCVLDQVSNFVRCIVCESNNFFFMFDGINCSPNTIANCLYQYQYMLDLSNTIQLNYAIKSQQGAITACAKCQDGYVNAFQQCILPNSTITWTQGDNILQLPPSNAIVYLYYQKNRTLESFAYNSNCGISQCINCVMYKNIYYCVKCNDGYYPQIFNGQCIQCPLTLNCLTCLQQNQKYQDGWKWSVRLFYLQQFSMQPDFIVSSVTNTQDYEVICTICKSGYELYNNLCIPNCPTTCISCYKQNNQNICQRCPPSTQGKLLSIYNNSCISCPLNCQLCQPRTKEQIAYINPYFAPDDPNNLIYSHICLQQINQADLNLQYNKALGQFISCLDVNNIPIDYCAQKITFQINVYCSDTKFDSDYKQAENDYTDDDFLKQNIKLSTLFSKEQDNTHFENIENNIMITYMNQQQTSSVTYKLKFREITDPASETCSISSKSALYSILPQNLFSLQELILIIDFQNQKVQIEDQIGIDGFTNVQLMNGQFYQGSTINIIHQLNLQVLIDTITILSSTENSFLVNVLNPLKITVNNLQISQLIFSNTQGIFQYSLSNSQIKNVQLKFSQIKIEKCQFINSFFIMFHTENQNQQVSSDFSNLQILSTNFNQKSSFFKEGNFTDQSGQLLLHGFKISDLRLDNSLIIDCNIYTIRISNDNPNSQNEISGTITNSSIIRSKDLNIRQTNFINIIMTNASILIDATGVTLTNNIYNFLLQNCQFSKIQYSQDSILIQQTNNNIQSTFTIQSCSFTSYQIDSQNFNTSSFLIYVWSRTAKITDTQFLRGEGKADFWFRDLVSITFDKVQIKGINIKGLHPSIDCLQKLIKITNYNSFMVIQNVTSFVFQNSIIQSIMTSSQSIIKLEIIDKSQQIDVQFTNMQFLNNLLINYLEENSVSIIQLNSQYNGSITIKDCQFKYNIQNSYEQSYQQLSGTLFQLDGLQLNIYIKNILIDTNYMFNSSDSLIYIHAKQLFIENSAFLNSNTYNDILTNFVFWSTQVGDIVYQEGFFNKFPIKSEGGIAKLQAQQVYITDSKFINSTAINGAGLNLQIQNFIYIDRVNFTNLQNKLSGSISQGGALYIQFDGGQCNLTILNTNFTNIYALQLGGAIHINAQYSTITSLLYKVNFKNVYSFQGSILYIIQNQDSNIKMENIAVIDSFQAFRQYLDKFDNIETQELVNYQSNNQLFFVLYGSVIIKEFSCNYLYMRGFIYIDKAVIITLTSIDISNAYLSTNNLISIFPYQYLSTQILIFQMKITNGKTINITQSCIPFIKQFQLDFQCIDSTAPPKTMISGFTNVDNRTDCLIKSLNHYSGQLNLIYIESIQKTDRLQINQLTITNVNCTYCSKGMIRVQQIQLNETEFNNIIFDQIYLQNNVCGQGCLIITSNSQFDLQQLSSTRFLTELESSKFQQPYTVKLFNSVFMRNQAQFGSLILDMISILISDCVFLSNVASQSGGAINYQGNENTSINIFSSLVSNNSAKVGGAFNFLNFQLSDPALLQLLMESNNATEYGQDSSQSPISLSVSFTQGKSIENTVRVISTSNQIVDQVEIAPYLLMGQKTPTKLKIFPSGQILKNYQYYNSSSSNYTNYNLSLQIVALDKLRQVQKNIDFTYCLLSQRTVNITQINESIPFTNNSLSITNISFNSTTLEYNLDDLSIKFNPYQDKDLVFQIQFYCPAVKVPVLNTQPPYNIKSYIYNYTLRLNVQTFRCQKGEVFNQNEGTCLQCDSSQSYYSVTQGSQCQIKDDVSTKSVRSAQIQLKYGYWRPYDESTVIEYCLHLDSNCEGGWIPGDSSCAVGHIGALCEQCDLYNIMGSGPYALSGNYVCGSCESISGNGITIAAITLWTLISVLMSVRGTLEMVDQLIGGLKAMALGLVISVEKQGSIAILMKILTNYLQIVSSISTFQLKFPSAIDSIFNTVGNPVQSMAYSLDCFLVELTSIQILYFRMIWALFMPLFYITIFFALYAIAIALNKTQYNISVISTTLIYMYIYLQPNLVGGLISLLSFRQISQVYWVQGNVSYIYNSSTHLKWILSFVFPCLIVIGFVIPFYLYNRLTNVKDKLGKIENVQLWGYLFNEYRKQTYYWEIVKIMQKELIIIFLTFYQDLIVIKAALIFIVIFLYDLMTKSKKPYLRTDLNELDEQSSFICAFSIVLGMTIYTAASSGNQEIVWPFYFLIAIFNIYFLIKLFIVILLGYVNQLRYQLDLVRDKINQKYPQIQQTHPYLKRMLQNSHEQQKRVKQRFRKIKEYLMPQARQIAKFKMENNFFSYEPGSNESQTPDMIHDAKVYPEQQINIEKPKLFIKDIDLILEKPASPPKSSQKKRSPEKQVQAPEHQSLIENQHEQQNQQIIRSLIKSPIQSSQSNLMRLSENDQVQEKNRTYELHELQE